MPTLSEKYPSGGDFVIHMESTQACLLSAPVAVASGATAACALKAVAGMPVIVDSLTTPTKATLLQVGLSNYTYNNVNGFLVFGPRQASIAKGATTAEKYSVLVAGPAVLNEDAIPNLDTQGNPIVIATLKAGTVVAARIADGSFKFVDESDYTRTQTPAPTTPS